MPDTEIAAGYRPSRMPAIDWLLVLLISGVSVLALALAIWLVTRTGRSLTELTSGLRAQTSDLARRQSGAVDLLALQTSSASAADIDERIGQVLETAMAAVVADEGEILIPGDGTDSLSLLIHHSSNTGRPSEPASAQRLVALAIGNRVWSEQTLMQIEDLQSDDRWTSEAKTGDIPRSVLAAPLVSYGVPQGVMLLSSWRPHAYDSEHLRLAGAAGDYLAVLLHLAELHRKLRSKDRLIDDLSHAQEVEASKSLAILESIAEGVLVTDGSHRVVVCNSAAEAVLGLRGDTIVGHPVVEYIGVYGKAGRRWVEAIQRWSAQPPGAQDSTPLSEQLLLEDQRVVAVLVAPVLSQGNFLGTVSTFRDITRAVEVDRLKSEFVATVSHELRTPMTSIRGYVQILLLDAAGSLNDEQRRFLETIKENTDRLARLVNDLLDISRLETGHAALRLQAIAPEAAIASARDYIENRCRAGGKALHIIAATPPGLPPVHADPGRLQQIFSALLDNSFFYTPAGGVIRMTARQAGEILEFEVSDTGVGIPAADTPRIFERFFRGEPALNLGVPGTGLGLSIVAQLVEMHGGQIRVESSGEPGKGSTFTFSLPLAPVPTPETEG